jgi:hypothetical protein
MYARLASGWTVGRILFILGIQLFILHGSVTGEYEHSILKYGGPSMGNKTQHVDFHEN